MLSFEDKSTYIKYQKKNSKTKIDVIRDQIPSEEQAIILNHIKSGNNVICNSVAGAGKTTTVMMLAKNNPNKNIHMVTYNSMLKEEVRQKAKKYNNLTVHNYHSLAKVSYIKNHSDYDHNTVFDNILSNNLKPIKPISIDIIVVDETQDMEIIFFKFLQKFIQDIGNPNLQYLIMGDNNQAVYEFKGSDARFLTLADKIWQLPMISTSLTTSYRITNQIANFVNEVMLDKSFITANKDGPNVKFIIEENIVKKYTVAKYLATYLLNLITNGVIKAEDIFVLVASLKANDHYQCLEHMLVNAGIDCYVSNKEDSNKKSVTKGKVVFTTFHQSKGGERPIVIVYDFDDNYFSFYNKSKPDNICCSELYVATTRASKELIVVQFKKPLKFLNMKKLISASYIDFPFLKPEINVDDKEDANFLLAKAKKNQYKLLNPTEIIKYLPEDIKNMCTAAVVELFKTKKKPTDRSFKMPATMKRKNNLEEDICDLIGLAIPALFQKNKLGSQSEIEKFCEMKINNNKGQNHDIRTKFYYKHNDNDPYLFKMANLYSCFVDNINNRLRQIDDYDWLTREQINICLDNLKANVGYCEFEKYIGNGDDIYNCNNENLDKYITEKLGKDFKQKNLFAHNIIIEGRIDAYDDNIVWEFKCVNELTLVHKLQVILYAFIWNMFHKEHDGHRKFRLLNIINGEVLELDMTSNKFDEVVCALLKHKIETRDVLSDEKFVKKCLQFS
jgi:hypothetical protein